MDRRRFILTTMAGAIGSPTAAYAQRPRAVSRIGFISNSDPTSGSALVDAFRRGLADLGWVEGHGVSIDYRWAEGDLGRHPQLVAELMALNPDVIVVAGTVAARAAMRQTHKIPIVGAVVGDPVAAGLATTLARPGKNLTGLAWQSSDLVTKQLQL